MTQRLLILSSAIEKMNLKINLPLERILHLHFDRQHELAATFLRFKEHYESPEFRGKVFTLDEYKAWYVANSPEGKKSGRFTYYEDWEAFNIPSEMLQPFYRGDFNPLSEREKELLCLLEGKKDGPPFYVIGTYGKIKMDILKHEVAHGLFHTRPGYRTAVLEIIQAMPEVGRKYIKGLLEISGGYHPGVFDDEIQAYLLNGLDGLEDVENEHFNPVDARVLRETTLKETAEKLKAVFREHTSGMFDAGRKQRKYLRPQEFRPSGRNKNNVNRILFRR